MGDEHTEPGGAELPAEAIDEPTRTVVDDQWSGLLPAISAAPLREDAEQYWQGFIAQLEAEADQIRTQRREDP